MDIIDETSGTTSTLIKRVVMSEEALLAMAEVDVADLDITSKSVIAIDRWGIPGIQRIVWSRVSGCNLAVYPGHEKISLRVWLLEQGITHLSTLASTFRWLCQGIYKFPLVKVLEIGGEMVDWDDVRLARERFPNAVFVNRYACSEARVICRKRVERDEPLGEGIFGGSLGRMPVGKPVKGVELAIVKDEIVVRSPYLADGYYNDPKLTAAKFTDGWYWTADKGYWLPNGELMHCGRLDFAEPGSGVV